MVSTRATEHSMRHRDEAALHHEEERREFELNHPRDGRDSSYDAANQHMVKFRKELWEVNDDIALEFDKSRNLAEFSKRERDEIVDVHAAAFENTRWSGLAERQEAADDIAQSIFKPLYHRVEIAEAAMDYNVSHVFLDAVREREAGALAGGGAAGEQLRKDLEGASQMVETAARNGCDISTGQLDECRDRFSDILYAGSDRSEIGVDAMKDAVENAVAYYEGNITPSMELQFSAGSREDLQDNLQDNTRHGESRDAEYRETGREDHGAEFNRLESIDEFAVGERIHRLLDGQLHHTTELAGEMAAQENPNLAQVENINETFRQIIHAGIMQSVENGDTEQFSTIMENLERANMDMANDMRANEGFIRAEPDQYSLQGASGTVGRIRDAQYIAETFRGTTESHQDEMPFMNHEIIKEMVDQMEEEIILIQDQEQNGREPGPEDFGRINAAIQSLNYLTRPQDPVMWKLCDMDRDQRQDAVREMVGEKMIEHRAIAHQDLGPGEEPKESTRVYLDSVMNEAVRGLSYHAGNGEYNSYMLNMKYLEQESPLEIQALLDGQVELHVEHLPAEPVPYWESDTGDWDQWRNEYLQQAERFLQECSLQAIDSETDKTSLSVIETLKNDYQEEMLMAMNNNEFARLDVLAGTITSIMNERGQAG